jgi:hypothetical protein
MYLTENLDKVRAMIGQGPWGTGRPERRIKHYLQMDENERRQTKELITRLAETLQAAPFSTEMKGE